MHYGLGNTHLPWRKHTQLLIAFLYNLINSVSATAYVWLFCAYFSVLLSHWSSFYSCSYFSRCVFHSNARQLFWTAAGGQLASAIKNDFRKKHNEIKHRKSQNGTFCSFSSTPSLTANGMTVWILREIPLLVTRLPATQTVLWSSQSGILSTTPLTVVHG